MTIAEWLKMARERVNTLDAELILVEILRDGARVGGGRDARAGSWGVNDAQMNGVDERKDLDRSYLVAHGEEEIAPEKVAILDKMLARREQGEPLAYILGWREFYGREFYVDSKVLIPRPETENMVDLALEALENGQNMVENRQKGVSGAAEATLAGGKTEVRLEQGLGVKGLKTPKKARILEIGTGSGCISLTLALEKSRIQRRSDKAGARVDADATGVEVWATDVSDRALEVARKNYARYQAEIEENGSKVWFLESDLLTEIRKLVKNGEFGSKMAEKDENSDAGMASWAENGAIFDVLVANLPYVDEKWEWLDRKSLDFEPGLALYAGEKGLELYRKLLEQVSELDRQMGQKAENRDFGSENSHKSVVLARRMVLEADPCQHGALIELAAQKGYKWVKTSGFALLFEQRL